MSGLKKCPSCFAELDYWVGSSNPIICPNCNEKWDQVKDLSDHPNTKCKDCRLPIWCVDEATMRRNLNHQSRWCSKCIRITYEKKVKNEPKYEVSSQRKPVCSYCGGSKEVLGHPCQVCTDGKS